MRFLTCWLYFVIVVAVVDVRGFRAIGSLERGIAIRDLTSLIILSIHDI